MIDCFVLVLVYVVCYNIDLLFGFKKIDMLIMVNLVYEVK